MDFESGSTAQPPPIPTADYSSEKTSAVVEGRLHPFTLLFNLLDLIRGFLVPAVILFFTGSDRALAYVLAVIFIPQLVMAFTRYYTFFYKIQNGELKTREGIFFKKERNISLARIQDIRLEQGVLHRMFRMAKVQVETAGGRGAEATLSVLAAQDAEQFRQSIFQLRDEVSAQTREAAVSAPPSPSRILKALTLRELVLAGLTSNRMASALAIAATVMAMADDVLPKALLERWETIFERSLESVVRQGTEHAVLVFGALGVLVILISVFFSVLGSVILFHGFKLSRQGEDLQRSYGLLTRRRSSISRRRIQILKIEEGFLRRLFGLAALRADTAGSLIPGQAEQAGSDVLVPAVRLAEVRELLPEMFPNLSAASPEWAQMAPVAIWRGVIKGSIWILLLTGLVVFKIGVVGWTALLLIPVSWWFHVINYRSLGFSLQPHFFWARQGWLKRETFIVPVASIQTVTIFQSPLDRLLGVATLTVDTAGQAATGGTPRLNNLPWPAGEGMVAELATLASKGRPPTLSAAPLAG